MTSLRKKNYHDYQKKVTELDIRRSLQEAIGTTKCGLHGKQRAIWGEDIKGPIQLRKQERVAGKLRGVMDGL